MDLKAEIQNIQQALVNTDAQLAQLTAQKYRLEGARNILLAQVQETETEVKKDEPCPSSPPTT